MQISVSSADEMTAAMSQTVVSMRVSSLVDSGPFSGTVNLVPLTPEVELNHLVTPAASAVRTARLIRQTDDDKLVVKYHTAGGTLQQFGRETTFGPGDGIIVDLTKPYFIAYPRGTNSMMLQVSRRALLSYSGGELPLGVPLPGNSALMRVLTRLGRDTLGVPEALDGPTREVIARTTMDLVGAAIGSLKAGRDVNPVGREALLRTLLDDIRSRLDDRDLSPRDLAARHHMSLRYVHALFTDIGSSPAAYIREQRLLHAFRILTDPRHQHRSIAQISAELGFGAPTTFLRAFQRRFGVTPSDHRSSGVAPGLTPVPAPAA